MSQRFFLLLGASLLCAPSAPAQLAAAPGDGHTAARPAWWSLERPQRHSPPPLEDPRWARQPIDAFVLGRLESSGLAPSPPADARTLLRRLTYDLTGLPPAPEALDAFAESDAVDAYEQEVDRLLASPRFGERWASVWLNLARFAEDQAHQVGSDEEHFYPNAYRYRDWLIGALNEDLPYDRFIRLQLAADVIDEPGARDQLAALGFLGLGPKYYGRGSLAVMSDEWEDRVDTVTRTFLGLTVACARCHDHKYDPISTADYHALAGVFASTRMVNAPLPGTAAPAEKMPNKRPAPNTIHIVAEGEPRDLPVYQRGDVDSPGPVAPRRFLTALSDGPPVPLQRGSGRLELAGAIADRDNPLTARVLVNRVWGACFGRPLAGTPSNLGALGEAPTHPQLLDDLAVRFMESGWSIKGLMRELVLSATYRQTSRDNAGGAAVDPDNVLLWRASRRRLEIEAWRDTMLAVSGTLSSATGGPSHDPADPGGTRRTVYSAISRLDLNDLLRLFDYPDPNIHSSSRTATTTPTQKLFFLNSPFVLSKSRALAARLAQEGLSPAGDGGDAARIERVHRLLFGRGPGADEMRLGLEFLAARDAGAWERYAQVLLASNDLMFLD